MLRKHVAIFKIHKQCKHFKIHKKCKHKKPLVSIKKRRLGFVYEGACVAHTGGARRGTARHASMPSRIERDVSLHSLEKQHLWAPRPVNCLNDVGMLKKTKKLNGARSIGHQIDNGTALARGRGQSSRGVEAYHRNVGASTSDAGVYHSNVGIPVDHPNNGSKKFLKLKKLRKLKNIKKFFGQQNKNNKMALATRRVRRKNGAGVYHSNVGTIVDHGSTVRCGGHGNRASVSTTCRDESELHRAKHPITSSVKLKATHQRTLSRYVTLPRSGGRMVKIPGPMAQRPTPPDKPATVGTSVDQAADGQEETMEPEPAQPASVQKAVTPLEPARERKWKKLVKLFAEAGKERPVEELLKMLPASAPSKRPMLLRWSIEALHREHPEEAVVGSDFKPVALFELISDLDAGHTPVAQYVFEMLVVGGGRFPTLFDGPQKSVHASTNGRKLIFPVHSDPWNKKKLKYDQPQIDIHRDLVMDEVVAGRYMGPFTKEEAEAWYDSFLAVSSFVVSKPGAKTTKFRLVQNCTDPKCNINAQLRRDLMYDVELDHTAVMIDMLRRLGRTGEQLHLVTADVSKGYRRLFHRVQDVSHLGISMTMSSDQIVKMFDGKQWTDKHVKKGDVLYVFDRSLPFGLATSVSSFCAVTTVIRDAVREMLGEKVGVVSYVDDFSIVGSPEDVARGITLLRDVLTKVGLPENVKKMDTPSPFGQYLGVDYDLSDPKAITCTLPEDKKLRYIRHLDFYIDKFETLKQTGKLKNGSMVLSRTDLQSIVGKLAHAAYIFGSGRPFYQRLLQQLRGRSSNKTIMVDQGSVDDMKWWRDILGSMSGVRLINPELEEVRIYTDASTTTGYGVMMRGQYFRGEWSPEIKALLVDFTITIAELELVALNFALETFGQQLQGCRVLFRCDNQACVANIHSMSSKLPLRACLLRRLYGVAAHFAIELKSTYINTHDNKHADFLSRNDMKKFFLLPQSFPLQEIAAPRLDAMPLLLDPLGPANLSTPHSLNVSGWKIPAH